MTMATLAVILSVGGILVTGLLAVLYVRDPVRGLAQTTHRPEFLPQVMADRYSAMCFLALGATVYGDLKVIAWLFTAFVLMGFADAWIYARAGHPYFKHLLSGVAAAVVVAVAVAAMALSGAA
ncbi:MAG: hypothetical protein H5U19_10680 [Rhodobacteraceae bacterium]|nr:hypothetical protein [Paracoccaceae bacterium]